MQTVNSVISNGDLIFAGPQQDILTQSAIIDGVLNLVDNGAKVILITYSPASPGIVQAIRSVKDRAVVVLAAGNSFGEGNKRDASTYSQVGEVALVSQALDQNGKAAYFTTVAAGGVWAPGQKVPFILLSGDVATRDGTSFSAAVTAGVVAALLADFPNATSQQIVRAVKAASGGPVSNPKPLTYPNAKEQLAKLMQPAANPGQ